MGKSTSLAIMIPLLTLGCNPTPTSPPATLPGISQEFDTLLAAANEKWIFIFANDFKIVKTDIYGNTDDEILDLRTITGKRNAEFLGRASFSPDGRYILTPYYYNRCGRNRINGKLILLDLTGKSAKYPAIDHEDFILGWYYPYNWLDSETFLVPIHKYTKGKKRMPDNMPSWDGYNAEETKKYLRFSLKDLNNSQVITLEYKDPKLIWQSNPAALLYASMDQPITEKRKVNALDINGKRSATDQESAYFEEEFRIELDYTRVRSPVNISIKKVISPGIVDGWGKYWEENQNRFYILINDKIVRCTDGGIRRTQMWDNDLNLFIWNEEDDLNQIDQVFYMDGQGHYRKWHAGHYWGKIQKELYAE